MKKNTKSLSDFPSFLASESPPVSTQEAFFHFIPAPYEKSVSYGKGTAAAPAAILRASQQLEVLTKGKIPAERGIFTHPPVDCSGPHEAALAAVTSVLKTVVEQGKFPILLGGEHTVTNAVLPLLAERGAGLVQFDAHADLRDSYEGSPLSHACVMKRAVDLGIPIAQVGIRSLSPEEDRLRKQLRIPRWDAAELHRNGICAWELPEDFPEKIYITFDVDALDPSIMPATGTPEPGGLGWYDAMKALQILGENRRIIGFDLVELAPIPGLHFPDYTCARLIYNFMSYVC